MIIRTPRDLGILVPATRKEWGWPRKELASRAGVSRLWLSQFENGKTTVRLGMVRRVLKELELELQVIPGSDTKPSPDSLIIDLDSVLEGNRNRTSAGE